MDTCHVDGPVYAVTSYMWNGHHDVVQTLVGAGADVNLATSVGLCSHTSTCTHRLLIARYMLY